MKAPHPELHEEFALDPELLYLNSGTHSICPRVVFDAVQRHQREFERNPTLNLFRAWGRLWEAQKKLALFFGADAADLFLRPNVTAAMNAFVLGMPLPKGSEIAVSDLEYGAILNIARFRAERDGHPLRTIHIPATPGELARLDSESLVDSILAQLRPETSLLILSDVMTGNGLVVPLRELARETRRRGVLLAIDGAHGPGFLPHDFATLDDLDFYGGNLHKWMLGPKGTGFGWLPKRHQSAIRPIQAGWTTFETGPVFSAFGDGSRFQGAFLLNGCHDFAPFLAISELMDFWARIGRDRVVSRIRGLQTFLEMKMRELPAWKLASPPANSPLRGQLLAYDLPPALQSQGMGLMGKLLEEHRLQVLVVPVQETWRLRLSPHVYITEAQLERTVEILGSLPA